MFMSVFAPANLFSSLHCSIVIHLQVVIVAVVVVLQVEWVKRQADQISRLDTDEPRTVGTMWIAGGVSGAGDGAWRTCQSVSTTWHKQQGVKGQHSSKATFKLKI